jgi:hypothetical protein
MADFPARRLLDADATMDEVAQLRQEWEASDASVQDGWVELFRTLSAGGIRSWLRSWRDKPESPETVLGVDYGEARSGLPDAPEVDGDEDDPESTPTSEPESLPAPEE